MKLTTISNGYYRYDPQPPQLPLPWYPERPLAPEPGYSLVSGDALGSMIFTRPEIEARFVRPEITPGTPFYVSIPSDSFLPRTSANRRITIPISTDLLPLVTKPPYRGSYCLTGPEHVLYCPPPTLSADAFAAIGYHVASPLDRFFAGERIVPITASDLHGRANTAPVGIALPIQHFEASAALGLEVLSATALTPDGLVADSLTILDPLLAQHYYSWLGEFPRWSRLTFAQHVEETLTTPALEEIPLPMVSRLKLAASHYFIVDGALILPTALLVYRENAEPIRLLQDSSTYLAQPWDSVRLALTEAIARHGHDDDEKPLYRTAGLTLTMSEIYSDTLCSTSVSSDDDLPF